ncbi:uncharacterized protein METZ01_LOCUS374263 [marine metagenome]|uniref:Uncharacterized protein n=1 Tax=marine metagenome TaxID=408172 RepID=A0A382TH22_9ZZZZ
MRRNKKHLTSFDAAKTDTNVHAVKYQLERRNRSGERG